jgi:hypothetical protein
MASGAGFRINTPTVGAGSAVTAGYGIWIQPQNWTGATTTNGYGIRIEDVTGATNNYSIFTGLGKAQFGDNVSIVGNLRIGSTVTPSVDIGLRITNIASTGTTVNLIQADAQLPATTTGSAACASFGVATTAAAFTLTNAYGIFITNPSIGAGSTITNGFGIRITNQTWTGSTLGIGLDIAAVTGATTNYAIRTNTGQVSFGDVVLMSSTLTVTTSVISPIYGTATAVSPTIVRNSVTQVTFNSLSADFAGDVTVPTGKVFRVNAIQVVSARVTGYTNAMTGTKNRATAYATGTITLVQLAERVGAIEDDLLAHGLIGP